MPIIQTFLSKFIEPCNQFLNNTLIDLREKTYNDGTLIITKTSTHIETHITSVFENYDKMQTKQVALLLVEYCSIWLYYFFKNSLYIVKEQYLEIEVLFGILNNTF